MPSTILGVLLISEELSKVFWEIHWNMPSERIGNSESTKKRSICSKTLVYANPINNKALIIFGRVQAFIKH